jgi:hypothetical protein
MSVPSSVASSGVEYGPRSDMALGPITRINAARRAREEHKLSCPWDHLRVTFKITTRKNRDEFLAGFDAIRSRLPEGWYCEKIYYVARNTPVERVDFFVTGLPRFSDGAAVRACLNLIQ